MDRFTYVDPKEPRECGYCPHCEEVIYEGEEIVNIQIEDVQVHADCFAEYIYILLECKDCYAGEE